MSNRSMEERFETPNVKGEWEASSVRVPSHVSSAADFRRFVAEMNKRAKDQGEFVRYRSIESEDAFP